MIRHESSELRLGSGRRWTLGKAARTSDRFGDRASSSDGIFPGRRFAPLLVLTLALLSTGAVTWYLHRTAIAKDRERFSNQIERTRRDIAARFETYVAMLTGAAGLFAASDAVTLSGFQAYAERLDLAERFPGVQGIGWSRRMREGERAEIVTAMRAQGFEDFGIWPADHPGPETHAIVYLEPLDRRNRAAIGFDMSSEPTRREAMERARDTGQAAASGRVTLVQEIDERKQAGFLVYVPVYHGATIPDSVNERRSQLAGFVYSPFRADDLFEGSFRGESHPRLHFDVYDGSLASPDSLLHSSDDTAPLTHSRLTATETFQIAGRPWTVQFMTRPDFEASSGRETAYVVLAMGVLVSLALTGVTWSQTHAWATADASAAGLAASREEVQRLLENERVQADHLREADRRKDEFLAILAHELRNPLAPISNGLQVWPLVRDDADELDRIRDVMTRQVAQLVRLIDDLLDVSRISRGKIKLRSERTDLREVIDAAVEGTMPLLEQRDQELHLSLPEPPPRLDGDFTRLVQTFTNLLNNASKYTQSGGRVEVTASIELITVGDQPPRLEAAAENDAHMTGTGRVVVTVTDTGEGIPADMLDRVFDMFAQVDRTLDRSEGGLGIGLTLVRSLVQLHGGTVSAHSEGLGKGSTFTVTLPLAATAEQVAPNRDGSATDTDSVPSHRVLVIDDVRASSRTLALMLRRIGQDTREANDGHTGLVEAEQFAPHVVFCDIGMPGMDGYEVGRRLCQRATERDGHRPLLVALTGYGQDEDRRRALAAGFDYHLVKPTSLDALRKILTEVVI